MDADTQARLDSFFDFVTAQARERLSFKGTARRVQGEGDHEDSQVIRLYLDNHAWLEAAVLPAAGRVRVGFATDSRNGNEDAEQLIEDSKESLDEFLELGLADAGHDDDHYSMEHFHESGIFFFATHLEVDSLEALADPSLREEVFKLLEGYSFAFEELFEE